MQKKFMACMVITAFAAFVIAPAASASPALTSNGTLVPTGTSITAQSTGFVYFQNGFGVECTLADLSVTVTANTGTTIAAKVPKGGASLSGTGSGGDCTSNSGSVKITMNSALCLDAVKGSDNITINGCTEKTKIGKVEVEVEEPVTFTLNMTGLGISCPYSPASVNGSVTGWYTTNFSAEVNLGSQPFLLESGQSIFCPPEGTLTMFTDLYTTDGTRLQIS